MVPSLPCLSFLRAVAKAGEITAVVRELFLDTALVLPCDLTEGEREDLCDLVTSFAGLPVQVALREGDLKPGHVCLLIELVVEDPIPPSGSVVLAVRAATVGRRRLDASQILRRLSVALLAAIGRHSHGTRLAEIADWAEHVADSPSVALRFAAAAHPAQLVKTRAADADLVAEGLTEVLAWLFRGVDPRVVEWVLARALPAKNAERLVSTEAAILGERAALQRALAAGLVEHLHEVEDADDVLDLRLPIAVLGRLGDLPVALEWPAIAARLKPRLHPQVYSTCRKRNERDGEGAWRVTEQMFYNNEFFAMHDMTGRRSAMLGVLLLGLVGATMTGACGAPSESGCPAEDVTPPDTPAEMPTACPAPVEEPCMRYHIPLVGNPSTDVSLRNKYIAAFGTACYMSELDTFDCFYKDWQAACADAAKIGEVSGNAPYDKGYTCQPVTGTDDYTLQIGSDVANKIPINYQAAPRQTPLVEVDGVPTEVSGPYRNLMEPPTLGTGQPFNKCDSGMVNDKGESLTQTQWILQVNSKANKGEIRSDLAGFEYTCGVDENCKPKTCKEPLVLKAGPPNDPDAAQVHHVVPMNDKRSCSWGTNSNKNAAVISARLNKYFTNNNPPAEEVKMLNIATAYAP